MSGRQKGTTWIVVANQELMRIYARQTKLGEITEVARLEHPEGNLQSRELGTDRPGRLGSVALGRHGVEPPTDLKEQEAERFAKEIGRVIEDGRTHDRFASLVLVAGPAFLGRLRNQLSPAASKMIEREIVKNMYQFEAEEIRELVANAELG